MNTEERIIRASFHVLEENGLSKTTTKKIAEEAGVSEVTIFRKFKSKDNLIEISKKVFVEHFLEQIDEIFDYDDNISVNEYLKTSFKNIASLPENDFKIIKVALEEIEGIPFEDSIILKIADTIIAKLKNFFDMQISKNLIRNVNSTVLAINIYSICFESVVLWKFFGKNPQYDIEKYIDDFLDVLNNGISIQ